MAERNTGLKRLYFPDEQSPDLPGDFIDEFALQASPRTELRGIGNVPILDRVVAEGYRTQPDDRAEARLARLTRLPGSRVERTIERARAFTANGIRPILEVTDDSDHRMPFDSDGFMTSSLLASMIAHGHQERLNGHHYAVHPMSVAALWLASYESMPNQSNWRRGFAVSATHDTLEELLARHKSDARLAAVESGTMSAHRRPSYLQNGEGSPELIVDPLTLRMLFEAAGRSDGMVAARQLLVLTKTISLDGEKISDSAYEAGVEQFPTTAAVKYLDRLDNSSDPRVKKGDKPSANDELIVKKYQALLDDAEERGIVDERVTAQRDGDVGLTLERIWESVYRPLLGNRAVGLLLERHGVDVDRLREPAPRG